MPGNLYNNNNGFRVSTNRQVSEAATSWFTRTASPMVDQPVEIHNISVARPALFRPLPVCTP